MTLDPAIREQIYSYFLSEAQDLLKAIEQDLLTLKEDRSTARIHNLLRSVHTLKGGAASVGLETIKNVAHVMEDVFTALRNPQVVIDAEVESLLFQGYECLRLPLVAEVTGGQVDEPDVLNRAAAIIARLQEKLGDCFNHDAPIPTSADLGVDYVQHLFETGIAERLDDLAEAIEKGKPVQIAELLRDKAEVFLGLAESSGLPGFAAIAQATLNALDAHPDQVMAIAGVAFNDFCRGQDAVFGGDRTQGGSPSAELLQWTIPAPPPIPELEAVELPSSEPELSLNELFGNCPPPTSGIPDPQPVEPELPPACVLPPPVSSTPPLREPLSPTVRVELTQLERLNHLAGELLIGQNQLINQDDQHRANVQTLLKRLRRFQHTLGELRDWADRRATDPVPQTLATATPYPVSAPYAANFDSLELDRYSELDVLVQSALDDAAQIETLTEGIEQFTKTSKRSLKSHQRLLTHLRDDLTVARMQPLGDLLNRFPRVLQQLASTHGKPVELHLTGNEVLVDKAIVEKLYDPLLHLIRNAFDHGIEDPETRQAQGKSATGRIEIRAHHQGNRTIIEIKDDGQGIDLQKVAQRAVELNLLAVDQLEGLTTAQTLDFLFQPGFSTASHLSDLSGRGMGLDVVRAQLQRLKGMVTVHSLPQQGTTFSLQIPLSVTITKLLVCQTRGVAYALPVDAIEQVVMPQPGQLEAITRTALPTSRDGTPEQRVVLHWQKNQETCEIPVRTLDELVQYSSLGARILSLQGRSPLPHHSPVLLLHSPTGRYGIQVDQVLGEQELVIRPIESDVTPPAYVYGCCSLHNSRLALVIDPNALLRQSTELEPNRRAAGSVRPSSPPLSRQADSTAPHSSDRPGIVLLVDDSLTLRQTLTLTLQKAGYSVAQAGDGLEALVQLRQHPNTVSLIICDVEMPGLNGFEFLTQSRRDPSLAHIPVVMLTSRSGSKYRQIAEELGASAYLTKPYTDQELLSILSKLL